MNPEWSPENSAIDRRRIPESHVGRLPVNVLHSEVCLGTAPVSDQHITEIVDELFLPLAADQPG